MTPIKALLAEDHGIVRSGIKFLLESEGDIQVIAEASNGIEALEQTRLYHPDLAILDVRMPVMNGLEATRKILEQSPETKVLILSMHDDEEYIFQSVDLGASGYLLKGSSKEEFLKAVRTVYAGQQYFSADVSRVFVNTYINSKRQVPASSVEKKQHYDLSKRESQILRMLVGGISNKEIAGQLNKSIRTIETHRFNIMKKLGVNNVVELLKKVEEEKSLKDFLENQQ